MASLKRIFKKKLSRATHQKSDTRENTSKDLIRQADELFANGDLDGAAKLYKEIQEIAPGGIHPLCRLGEITIRQKQYQLAERHFRQAIDCQTDSFRAHFGLANTLIGQQKLQSALVVLEKASELDPGNQDVMQQRETVKNTLTDIQQRLDLANEHFAKNELDSARPIYLEIIKINADSPHALCRLGTIALRKRFPQEAIHFFQQAIASSPEYPWGYSGLAQSYASLRHWKRAEELYTRADELAKDEPFITEGLRTATEQRKAQEASLQEILPKADQAYDSGQTTLAEKLYRQAVELAPFVEEPLYRLGELALRRDNWTAALEYFDRTLEIAPKHLNALIKKSKCLSKCKRMADAVQCLELAHSFATDDAMVAELLQHAHASQKEQAARIQTEADRLYKANNLDEARSAYEQLAKIIGNVSAAPWCRLGKIAIKQNDPHTALKYYQKATAVAPKYLWAHYGLGKSLGLLNRWSEAKSALSQAKEINPDNELVVHLYDEVIKNEAFEAVWKLVNEGQIEKAKTAFAHRLLIHPEVEGSEKIVQAFYDKGKNDLHQPLLTYRLAVEMNKLFNEGLIDLTKDMGTEA